MRARDKIQKALAQIMRPDEARACAVWKGYDAAIGCPGWHYAPFGCTAQYLGSSVDEALETIEAIADSRDNA